MDEAPTIAGVKLDPVQVEAMPGQKWLAATVLVHFGGPNKSITLQGILIPDKGNEPMSERLAIAEAQRLARFFAQDTKLATEHGKA